LIENIPSREHQALLHFALSSTFRDSRVEKYLIINEENSFLEQQGLHQDSSGGFVSFFCEEGGGIVPTVFINHTDLSNALDNNTKKLLDRAGFWDTDLNKLSLNLFHPTVFNQDFSEEEVAAIQYVIDIADQKYSLKITLKNNDVVLFDDERLLHGRGVLTELEQERRIRRIYTESSSRG
jgi:hypothetical protein